MWGPGIQLTSSDLTKCHTAEPSDLLLSNLFCKGMDHPPEPHF